MCSLHQTPMHLITVCINGLYKAREISAEENKALRDLASQSSKSGDWEEMRKQLFKLRANSCRKKLIDNAIDATREKTGGNVL